MKRQNLSAQRREELLRLIRKTEDAQKGIRMIVRDLSNQYQRQLLSRNTYRAKMKEMFGIHTPLSLLRSYDSLLKQYCRELRRLESQEKKKHARMHLLIFFGILLSFGFFFSFQPMFTGFFSATNMQQEIPLLIHAPQDMHYSFSLPEGEIHSLRISGTLEGEGSAQISLDTSTTVLYDSAYAQEQKKGLLSILTGFLSASVKPDEPLLDITDDAGIPIPYTVNIQEKDTQIFFPDAKQFPELIFSDLEGGHLRISSTVRGVVEPEEALFTRHYVLDASNLTFLYGRLSARATGDALYRCPIFDDAVGVCLSGWEFFKTLQEDKKYMISFESGIIALAEGKRKNATAGKDDFFPLEAVDAAAQNVQLGDVVKIDILAKNLVAAPLADATVRFILEDAAYNTLADIQSDAVLFEPEALGSFKLYWDTAGILPGTYTGSLTLATEGKKQTKAIRMHITPKSISTAFLDITGNIVKTPRLPLRFFSDACIDTCALKNITSGNHTLIISVKNAILNITSLLYEIRPFENSTQNNISQSPFNNTTKTTQISLPGKGNIRIDAQKITYRDETKKQHQIKKYRMDETREYGKNWERSCAGSSCVHALYTYDRYYEREDGAFDLLENALTQESCMLEDELCIRAKNHHIHFKQQSSQPETVRITKQNNTFSFQPLQLRAFSQNESWVLSSANPVSGKGENNMYTYAHALGENIHLRFTYTPDALKEEVIFEDDTFLGNISFPENAFVAVDYAILQPPQTEWYGSDGLLLSLVADQEIAADILQLRDVHGKNIFTLPQPILFAGEESVALQYHAHKQDNLMLLSISMPLSFFLNQTFPIILDPTIQLTDANIAFDGHIRFTPSSGEYARTGTATSFSVGTTTGPAACQPAPGSTCKLRGGFDWDIASIPDNAELVDINLTLRVSVLGSPDTTMFFYHMDGNSSTYANTAAGNQGFYTDMGNGTNYFNQTVAATGFTYFNITRPQLLSDLHALLLSGSNSWSFGIISNETGPAGSSATEFNSEEATTASQRPQITFIYNLPPPSIILNAPANNSRFAEFVNITLNATIYDNEPTIKEVVFYGGNTQPPQAQDIIALFRNVTNNTVLQYNWTAPVQAVDRDTVLLFHFDNRSEFGENSTKVVDFSNLSNNGTIGGTGVTNIFFNATGGKLGGAYRFNASTTGNNRNITLGDQDELIGAGFTYLFWTSPANTSKNGTIMSKYNPSLSQGFAVSLGSNGDLQITTDATTTRLSSFFSQNTYTHVGITLDSNNQLTVYKNGISQTTQATAGVSANNIPFDIAIETNPNDASFVGYLDELVILNRSLSAAEIVDRFRLKGDVYFWYVNATDTTVAINGTNMSEIRMFTVSMKPNITQVSITPSIAANTTDTLNCTFTVVDVNGGETLTANVTFYNNSAFFQSFLATVTNGTQAGQALTAETPARGESWHCGVIPSDGIQNGDQKNSSTISIVNSVPSLPVLAGPPALFTTTDVNIRFNWTSSVDADGDSINYTLNITCFSTSGGSCTAPGDNRLENITTNVTTVSNNFRFRIDDGFYYNWTVRATDGTNQSSYASPRPFNITVLVALALTTNTVNFQSLGIGQTNDTSDSSPVPFTIQNQGNSFIEINISATGTNLFTQSPMPSSAFQFKARNVVPPEGTGQIINTTRSTTTYTNVARTNTTVIAGFNYTSPANSADIDINVTVPSDEPSGAKGTSLLLTGYYIGGLT